MPLLDLAQVTRTLIRLLEQSFLSSPAWTQGNPPAISPLPPHKIQSDGLGLYLYHITEEAHTKNLAPQAPEAVGAALPLGLALYYQLTAHATAQQESGIYQAQLMMGIAVKAFHDLPVVNRESRINGVTLFPPALQGSDNRFRLCFHSLSAADAVNFWTAGTLPLQLSSYYQVSVIYLEPEAAARSARVLGYGVRLSAQGPPRLEGSQNRLSFTIPGESNPRTVTLSPAQVAVGQEVLFYGYGFHEQESRFLLNHRDFAEPQVADAAWDARFSQGKVKVRIQESINGKPVIPGVYSGRVRVRFIHQYSDGREQEEFHDSNEIPLMIVPRIDSVSVPDSQGKLVVKGYLFRHPRIPPEQLLLYVGAIRLQPGDPQALNPGEYGVQDAPPGEIHPVLKLRLPSGLHSGSYYPLRVVVMGAESAPHWIAAP